MSLHKNGHHLFALSVGSPTCDYRTNDQRKYLHHMKKRLFVALVLTFALVFPAATATGLLYWNPEKTISTMA